MIGVYKITCQPTGDFYIGSSKNIQSRWKAHRYDISKGLKKGKFLSLTEIYSLSDFYFEILEECKLGGLIPLEQSYIDKCKPSLNISKNAYNPSLDPTIEKRSTPGDLHSCAKLSNAEYLEIFSWFYNNPHAKALDSLPIFPKATKKMVESIYGMEKHKWMQEVVPNMYAEMLVRKKKRVSDKFKCRHLINPEGLIFSFGNMSKFCKDHGLSQPKVSQVCNAKQKTHKGWRLPTEEELNNYIGKV